MEWAFRKLIGRCWGLAKLWFSTMSALYWDSKCIIELPAGREDKLNLKLNKAKAAFRKCVQSGSILWMRDIRFSFISLSRKSLPNMNMNIWQRIRGQPIDAIHYQHTSLLQFVCNGRGPKYWAKIYFGLSKLNESLLLLWLMDRLHYLFILHPYWSHPLIFILFEIFEIWWRLPCRIISSPNGRVGAVVIDVDVVIVETDLIKNRKN